MRRLRRAVVTPLLIVIVLIGNARLFAASRTAGAAHGADTIGLFTPIAASEAEPPDGAWHALAIILASTAWEAAQKWWEIAMEYGEWDTVGYGLGFAVAEFAEEYVVAPYQEELAQQIQADFESWADGTGFAGHEMVTDASGSADVYLPNDPSVPWTPDQGWSISLTLNGIPDNEWGGSGGACQSDLDCQGGDSDLVCQGDQYSTNFPDVFTCIAGNPLLY